MSTIRLVGWTKGVKSVSLIEAVSTYSTGSLISAKKLVDSLLDGECVTLNFSDINQKDQFRVLAESYGALVE